MAEIKTYRGNKLLFVDEVYDTLVKVSKIGMNHYELSFVNRDGSEAEMCGNALMKFAIDYFAETGEDSLRMAVGEMSYFSAVFNKVIKVGMPPIEYENPNFNKHYWLADIGNKHKLYYYPRSYHDGVDFSKIPTEEANVSIVNIVDDTTIFVDTWERGVGKTESCGSAACCAAWVYCKEYLKKDAIILVKQTGGYIKIDCTGNFPVMIHEN